MGLNSIFIITVIIDVFCFSGTNAGNAVVCGHNVQLDVYGMKVYLVCRDGDYVADNDYVGKQIPNRYIASLCDEAARLSGDRTRDLSERPDFGAYRVTFTNNHRADPHFLNLLRCPATPKELYVERTEDRSYNVFRRYAGDGIILRMDQL